MWVEFYIALEVLFSPCNSTVNILTLIFFYRLKSSMEDTILLIHTKNFF